jgi:hypothetical protein
LIKCRLSDYRSVIQRVKGTKSAVSRLDHVR